MENDEIANLTDDEVGTINPNSVTDDFIHLLISCEKRVMNKRTPSELMTRCDRRYDLQLTSLDSQYRFTMTIRQNRILPDNFSVLLLLNDNGDIVSLFRCNGRHHSGDNVYDPLHYDYHTHTLSSTDWRNGNKKKPNIRKQALDYSSLEEAIVIFCRTCGIIENKEKIPFLIETQRLLERDRKDGLVERQQSLEMFWQEEENGASKV